LTKTHFENLRVYQLAEELSDAVWEMVKKWKPLATDTVGKQMIRAADSISANIAEGSGRGSQPELIRFARIARGSLYETRNWLRRAFRRKLMSADETEKLKKLLDELTLTLNGYLRAIQRRKT
jgi:four helix bundle protein